jgi:hypothetical protein
MIRDYTTTGLLGVAFDVADAEARFRLGHRVCGASGGEYVYVKFSAAVDQGHVVVLNDDGIAAPITTVAASTEFGTPVGVATVKAAINEFGWAQVEGVQDVRVIASVAANVKLSTTATGGELTGATTTGARQIDGLVLQAAAPAAANFPVAAPTYIVARASMSRPRVGIANP